MPAPEFLAHLLRRLTEAVALLVRFKDTTDPDQLQVLRAKTVRTLERIAGHHGEPEDEV